ncbi:MAG: hypothetical protein WCK84_03645 [Bacteroidota bacterium]
MKKSITLKGAGITLLLLAFIVILSGCANKELVTECLKGHTYGFWGGLWHGIIAPIDLIAMLWRNDVSVFAQNNNGAWYAFGFMIGSGGWGFLGGNRASRSYKR